MSPEDTFVMVDQDSPCPSPNAPQHHDSSKHAISSVAHAYNANLAGARVSTEGVLASALRDAYSSHHLLITPYYGFEVLAYADAHANEASYKPHMPEDKSLSERFFLPPERRYGDEKGGAFAEKLMFQAYEYKFRGNVFIIYIAEGGEGMVQRSTKVYVLVPPPKRSKDERMRCAEQEHERDVTNECEVDQEIRRGLASYQADELLATITRWMQETHQEVLVFDGGAWRKNKDLWRNVQKSEWEDIILADSKKTAIIKDVNGFFDSEERYAEYGVPWKRGVIFYGPPGNGKTISTKALMHTLSQRSHPRVDSLYVKSFVSYGGPQYAIRQVFVKARQMAPCLLIFEDIDSLITPAVRSYFLNEVDGLESNHGIMMIGSTNHLEMLDPGISKRPSRFDRKYIFENPVLEERKAYCRYWQGKLASKQKDRRSEAGVRGGGKIDFSDAVVDAAAERTDGFSFAYLKEAFVGALMLIAAEDDESEDPVVPLSKRLEAVNRLVKRDENKQENFVVWHDDSILRQEFTTRRQRVNNDESDDLKRSHFWQVLKKQIFNLRRELGEDAESLVS